MNKILLSLFSICTLVSFAQTPQNGTFCGSSLTFNVGGTGSYQWFSASTGGSSLGAGNQITVSRSQATLKSSSPDTVFSLFSQTASNNQFITGFSAASAAGGKYGTPSSSTLGLSKLRMTFTTTESLSIDSMTIRISSNLSCSNNPNPKISLTVYSPTDANFIITKTIAFVCKGAGAGTYRIPVGIDLPTAGNYGIKVNSGGSINLYQLEYLSPATNFYPLGNSPLIFTGDDDSDPNTHLIPSLYDWAVSTAQSGATRVEVTDTKHSLTNPNVASQSKTIAPKDPAPVLNAPTLTSDEMGRWTSNGQATISQNGQTGNLVVGANAFVYTISSSTFVSCAPKTDTVTITVANTLGISDLDLSAEGILVYPNPFKNELSVSWNKPESAVARLLDMSGVLKEEATLTSNSPTLMGEKLPAGLYILQVSLANGSKQMRVVKR